MPTPSEMRQWLRQPLTKWFFDQMTLKFGNLEVEWRALTTLEALSRNKGKADVLDHINQLITDPQSFDPVTPPEG